jgi:hypothetical protein
MKAFLLAVLLILTACTSPGYNDNPSQRITNTKLGCPAATDFFAVYFSLRVQPFSTDSENRINTDIFQSYCHDIPYPGKAFLTIDLIGHSLTTIPISIRIVELDSSGVEQYLGSAKTLRIISEIPATVYAKGIIETQFELSQSGYYAIELTRGNSQTASTEDKLRISLNVGNNTGKEAFRMMPLIVTILAPLLLGIWIYYLSRKRPA